MNKALHTDLYQINMVKSYWMEGLSERDSVFDVFFRKNPFNNGYTVFAGLQRVVDYINGFKFICSDISYLRTLGYPEDFLKYLGELKLTCTIKSVREGEIVFPNEPIMRLEGKLGHLQLIETAILNIVNFQSLIATKASRIRGVLNNTEVAMEFGTRRAQEMDAAIWGTRAAYIAGFNGTSNVEAGKLFGIPVMGTHAHAFVQAHDTELDAFMTYATTHETVSLLVDTYDTLKSGVPNAIKVGLWLEEQGRKLSSIRLDSGDLAYLSKKARKMLDEAGLDYVRICASNDLDEHLIATLKQQGSTIDMWGIGTKLITAFDQPALGAVYKLVAIKNNDGEYVPKIKISGNPEKVTTPGVKEVYRIISNETGMAIADYIALADEDVVALQGSRLRLFHPIHTYKFKYATDFTAEPILKTIFENGELVYDLPDVNQIKLFHKNRLDMFWDEYRRMLNPEEYAVDLSQNCWDNKMQLIHKVAEENM